MIADLLAQAYRYYGSGPPADASRLCRQIIEDQPRHVEAIYLLAALDHESGQSARAADGFRLAAEVAPDNPVFVNAWGESLHDHGQIDQAWDFYHEIQQKRDKARGIELIYMRRGVIICSDVP